ncbi:ribbon-helix-helix domain-containing protein [Natrialbaceae archaeon AArc-T1-2]|uniref:ribbon-helix-helix domain-containing protein n=1 Tax=Natrialbaceae archaeon AArc-T1-2 TaxID=3053904 RepID=UPI00255A9B71|nr:ribbon-helix-helix domain-containing protein [Natrialbaceae archaeon AArc-T1-2]WIV68690.1 ribbon-helix-helix domain-containing protein [Natrialbaceae archaeon AArc-T1-2]
MDHNPSSRVSFGCPDGLLEQLDEIADREEKSRSEKLRELVRKEVEAKGDLEGPQPVLPDDEQLADAYRTLHERAHAPYKDKPRVKLETAKNKLYDNDTPKSAVLDDVIKPLEKLGFLSVWPGNQNVWVVVPPMRYTDGEDVVMSAEKASA